MTRIYLHEYTIVPMDKEKMGLQSVTVRVVTESKERDTFLAERLLIGVVNLDQNISHKILLEGYRQDG